jgi:hypothetical protein
MNKYEVYLQKTVGRALYVIDWLSVHRAYCHIDELIRNPGIFPQQTTAFTLEDRRQWALEQWDNGCRWIVSGAREHDGCKFSLMAQESVPTMRYHHINKVWRMACEQA